MSAKIIEQIRKITGFKPDTGIILGSGWGETVSEIEKPIVINYSDLKGMPVCGVKGHTGRLIFGTLNGVKIVAMQGRFHLYEGRKTSETVITVEIMKGLGINTLIVTNAAGGINKDFKAGDIMIIEDHINLSGENPLVGLENNDEYPRFIDMTDCYNKELSQKIREKFISNNIQVKSGVYCQLKGPSYETKAEIIMLSALGVDAVGMSTAVEVIYSNYLKLKTVGISCITKMAAGISKDYLNHSDVLKVSKNNGQYLKSALLCALSAIKEN